MADEGAIYTRIAERIALLATLGNTPAEPSHNPYVQGAEDSIECALPPRAERHLTEALAFLSSIKDDPCLVTAVCCREFDDQLQVLVAVNAKVSSESEYLERVKRGFQDIFGLLQKAATTNHTTLEDGCLTAIIAMCRSRIVSRLGAQSDRNEPRLSLHVDGILARLRQLKGVEHKSKLQKAMNRLVLRLSEYTDCHNASPFAIIDECHDLCTVPSWRKILRVDLDRLNPRVNPELCQALINTVEKLAQYRVSAKTLTRIARRHEIVRKASIVAVRLEQDAFVSYEGRHYKPATTAREAFSRVLKSQRSNVNFDVLRQRIYSSEKEANKKFTTSLASALESSRVHAEMQLIWYLNSHPSSRPPRIIASHKDACYLCNALMAFHGIYTAPRSHGRLYPGWKLPTAGMQDVRVGFVEELGRLILIRAEVVLSRRQKYLEPRESRLNSTVTSLATILTVDEVIAAEEVGGSTSDAETIKPENSSSAPSSDSSSDMAVADDTAGIAELGVSSMDFARASLPTAAPPEPTQPNDDAPWQTIEQGQTTRLRLTRKLHIHVSYSATQPARQLRVKTHELSTAEMTAMDAANGAEQVYDVHRDLPLLQDVLCRSNCRIVYLQMKSTSQGQTRRSRVELG